MLLLMAGLLAAYAAWEYYWWQYAGGYHFIKWHTHLVATAILFSPMVLLAYIRKRLGAPAYQGRVLPVAISVWLGLLLCELILVVTGYTKSYHEVRFGFYQSPYYVYSNNVYNTFQGLDTIVHEGPEFRYSFPVNALGFTGREWDTARLPGVKRIITIGDSFTEGDGTSFDSTYPYILSQLLQSKGHPVEIFNAGVSGSDPIYGYKNLHDRLLVYKPDLVLVALSENDILFDFGVKGGFERFVNDSTVQGRAAPWWEPLYAASYTLRIMLNTLNLNLERIFVQDPPQQEVYNDRLAILETMMQRYDSLAARNSFQVVYIVFPTRHDFHVEEYPFPLKQVEAMVQKKPNAKLINLLPCYQQYARQHNKTYKDYYWVIDGHHNPQGYYMMAHCIAENLEW